MYPLAATDWGLLSATLGLVLATLSLAYFTRGLVREALATRREMVKSREEQKEERLLRVRPHLALDVDMLGPTFGVAAIKNLGPGTALRVDLVLSFDPPGQAIAWNEPVFAPGEPHQFLMPEQIRELQAASDQQTVIRAKGQYEDVYGNTLALDESFDLQKWWELLIKSNHRFEEDSATRIVRILDKTLDAVKKIAAK